MKLANWVQLKRPVSRQARSGPDQQLDHEAGLTLVETLIVLVIIGLVTAMIVPNIISRPDDARVTVARTDVRSISAALKMYRLDNRNYPSTAQGLRALVERPVGSPAPANWYGEGYLSEMPVDPWGNPYVYRSPGQRAPFDLLSLGADGKTGGDEYDTDISVRALR